MQDLALIDLATKFRRILMTSFIPIVLNFMGYRFIKCVGSSFFIRELETLHEIHLNLLSLSSTLTQTIDFERCGDPKASVRTSHPSVA